MKVLDLHQDGRYQRWIFVALQTKNVSNILLLMVYPQDPFRASILADQAQHCSPPSVQLLPYLDQPPLSSLLIWLHSHHQRAASHKASYRAPRQLTIHPLSHHNTIKEKFQGPKMQQFPSSSSS